MFNKQYKTTSFEAKKCFSNVQRIHGNTLEVKEWEFVPVSQPEYCWVRLHWKFFFYKVSGKIKPTKMITHAYWHFLLFQFFCSQLDPKRSFKLLTINEFIIMDIKFVLDTSLILCLLSFVHALLSSSPVLCHIMAIDQSCVP